ncbi:hypothetical protein [Anaeromyxobacter oryzisoli]|uniref:hypothetical protein n=1 Tax=Anaeromyxobacter oryzisoli TaxID=2925408 RepID=UPI001F5A3E51|nr:hypothetical protein [Anaeromyxobacter sp. SG63]
MRTRTRWLLPAALATASLACGHRAGSTHPPLQPQAEAAIPVVDPSAITTPRDRPTPAIDRVAVKLARTPGGGLKVLEVLSPDLTDTEKAELQQAIERGEARPEFEPERPVSTWTTTVIRRRP